MVPPVLSASLFSRDSLTLPSLALLFFSLLSVSFIPCRPLSSIFNIIAILPLFYCCSSLNLLRVRRTMTSSTKGPKRIGSSKAGSLFSSEDNSITQGQKFRRIKNSEPPHDDILLNTTQSSDNHVDASVFSEPPTSPFSNSPWSSHMNENAASFDPGVFAPNVLMGSLVREEGHIYSLAASGDLLYTGSDSKNIRVWKNQKEFSGFKSNSGLVKAIVISGDRIFTGHQDGKIRVWKVSSKNPSVHKRVGTLPTMMDYLKSSVKPSSYIEVRRKKNSIWLKHLDAISCLSLSEDGTFLYSASWDKTFKVWRVADSKCLESITAHDDAVNSLVAGFDGLVFTGSADGSVKVWRRELQGKGTKHFFSQTLIKQECAVTALTVNPEATVVYCGSSDGLVNFWEREQQLTHGGVLKGHKLAVLCLVTAGSLLFSGSADTAICVWRKMGNNHLCLSSLTGHSGPVKCLAAEKDFESTSNDRRWILYSGSLDKSVKMWRISEQAPPMSWNNNGNEAPIPATLPTAPSFASIS